MTGTPFINEPFGAYTLQQAKADSDRALEETRRRRMIVNIKREFGFTLISLLLATGIGFMGLTAIYS